MIEGYLQDPGLRAPFRVLGNLSGFSRVSGFRVYLGDQGT